MYLNELIKHKFFTDFSINQLKHYIDSNLITFKQYKKGHILHSECEPCFNLDIIISGNLNCYDLCEDGNALTMLNFHKDDIIGGNLLFSDRTFYPLNIHCKTDCLIAHLSKEVVSKLLIENNTFMIEFIKAISNNSLNLNKKMIIFSRKNLREGIMEFLKTQSKKQNSNIIKLPITKKQLADELGVQRPSLFRELKKMKNEKIIDYNSKQITILKDILD